MNQKKLLVVANNNLGSGLSGGDTICLNLIKQGQKYFSVSCMGSAEARALFTRYSVLPPVFYQTDKIFYLPVTSSFRFVFSQIRRTILSSVFFLRNINIFRQYTHVYTSSDFYPDLIIGFLFKIFIPKVKWIAGFYLIAPNPFDPTSPYIVNHRPLRGLIYFFGQTPSFLITKYFADYIFVTSTPDIAKFTSFHLPSSKIFVVQGGVNPLNFAKYIKSPLFIPVPKRRYDAVFMGRFHPQKGVLQLIDIWRLVTKKIPTAKLVLIGNGDLEDDINQLIHRYKLQQNISLAGFLEGKDKNKIFQNSKIVLHPSIYDSGGMAAAEAMAWGLPGVSFDLPALKTYYPQGMIKSIIGDNQDFANNIIALLQQPQLYQKTSQAAVALIKNNWNWSTRFKNIFKNIG